jgi:uncharacterized RDD family membrane protein YckC
LIAFGLDYVLIAAYLVVLAGTSLVVLASSLGKAYTAAWSTPWSGELAGFLLLTMPVILYFAILESTPTGATLGKRALGLRVLNLNGGPLEFGHALLRSAVKFLPWELSHFTVWQLFYGTSKHVTLPIWAGATIGVVYLLVAAYLMTLFVGRSHRTIYDRIAGSRVTSLV